MMRNPNQYSYTIRRFVACAGMLFIGSQLWPTVGQAQHLFPRFSESPDVAQYTTIDACLSVANRVRSTEYVVGIRTDTFPRGIWDAVDTLPTGLVSAVRHCVEKFTISQLFSQGKVGLGTANDMIYLLLLANRDDDAQALMQQWFVSISDDSVRTVGIQRFAFQHLGARPVRFATAWALLDSINPRTWWGESIGIVDGIFMQALRIQDTAMMRRAAEWLDKAPELVTDSIKQTYRWQFVFAPAIMRGMDYLNRSLILDSLRTSSVSYQRIMNSLEERASLLNTSRTKVKPATPVAGTFWFPERPTHSRPTPGSVSLVVAIGYSDCERCLPGIAILRRLHQQFPDVEITLVSKTAGFFGLTVAPPTPDEEAALIDSLYRRKYQLPGFLAVEQTPFWRLHGFDRRRINEAVENDSLYRGGEDPNKPASWWHISIVDRQNQIVTRSLLLSANEADIREKIAAVLQQPE